MVENAATFILSGRNLNYTKQRFTSIPDAERYLGSGKVLDYINYAHDLNQRSAAASKARTLSTYKAK